MEKCVAHRLKHGFKPMECFIHDAVDRDDKGGEISVAPFESSTDFLEFWTSRAWTPIYFLDVLIRLSNENNYWFS